MSAEDIAAIAAIAQSVTVVSVLVLWVYREIKRGDAAIIAILEDWRELKRERNANEGEFARSED